MARYTPEKINNAINSINDVIELSKKQNANYQNLLHVFNRIKWAMYTDFDKVIKQMVLEKSKEIEKERIAERKRDPLGGPSLQKGLITLAARQKIMRETPYFRLYPNELPRWDDFLFAARKTWEQDRTKYLKSGEIDKNASI